MRVIKFSLGHRLSALITHLTFLIRKVFIYPLILIAVLLLIFEPFIYEFNLFLEILFTIILNNIIMPILVPMTNFTRNFILKGLLFGISNVMIFGTSLWFFSKISSLHYFPFHFSFGSLSFLQCLLVDILCIRVQARLECNIPSLE